MGRVKAAILVGLAVGLGVAAMIGGKWYHITTAEKIDPQRGLYGMEGLEIWIELNSRMPDFARLWACETLLAREAAVLGAPVLRPPHGCQADFKARQAMDAPVIDTLIRVHTDQALARAPQANPAQMTAFRACLTTAFETALPAERRAAANDGDTDAMRDAVLAAQGAAQSCKASLGL